MAGYSAFSGANPANRNRRARSHAKQNTQFRQNMAAQQVPHHLLGVKHGPPKPMAKNKSKFPSAPKPPKPPPISPQQKYMAAQQRKRAKTQKLRALAVPKAPKSPMASKSPITRSRTSHTFHVTRHPSYTFRFNRQTR